MFAVFLFCLLLLLAPQARAQSKDDGLFRGGTPSLAIELVQLGDYGRLTLTSSGYGDMRYGRCRMNFKRDAKGGIEHSPFRPDGTARCPERVAFNLSQSESGFYRITFDTGGGLAGEIFPLTPRLRPMVQAFTDKPPQNFDILGLSPGMHRSEIETLLRARGFARNEDWSMRRGQPDLFSQNHEVWSKGRAELDPAHPEESIAVTYSALLQEGGEEHALHITRKWLIPFFDQPRDKVITQALEDKYGATTSGLSTRYYDKSGRFQPQAKLPFCPLDIHLQKVPLFIVQEGLRITREIASSCGSWVEIDLQPSAERPEHIGELNIALYRSDLIYANHWAIWSRFEAEILERDYDEHMGKTDKPPDL